MNVALASLKAASTEFGAALARRIAFLTAVGVLALTAFGFGLGAGWSALAELYGSVNASLLIAAGLTLVVCAAVATDAILRRRRQRRRKKRAASAASEPLGPLLAQTFVTALQTGRALGASKR